MMRRYEMHLMRRPKPIAATLFSETPRPMTLVTLDHTNAASADLFAPMGIFASMEYAAIQTKSFNSKRVVIIPVFVEPMVVLPAGVQIRVGNWTSMNLKSEKSVLFPSVEIVPSQPVILVLYKRTEMYGVGDTTPVGNSDRASFHPLPLLRIRCLSQVVRSPCTAVKTILVLLPLKETYGAPALVVPVNLDSLLTTDPGLNRNPFHFRSAV